jgi:RimJ/RimL family protein N-acetyltransferase
VIRVLTENDRAALDAFLAARASSSMFLRANLAKAGIADGVLPFQGRYAGAFTGDTLTDVAAHYWNDMLVLQAPENAGAVAQAAATDSPHAVAGVIGPWDQAVAAVDELRLRERARALQPEDLFEIDLARIKAPDALAIGAVTTRRVRAEDLPILISWRIEYEIETLGASPGPDTEARAKADMEAAVARGTYWVAIADGALMACSGFNARLPDIVQIGGVFTPKTLRGEGFARAAVAGSLFDARDEGVKRAILFTETRNAPAQRVYRALGFERVGDYGLILMKE